MSKLGPRGSVFLHCLAPTSGSGVFKWVGVKSGPAEAGLNTPGIE